MLATTSLIMDVEELLNDIDSVLNDEDISSNSQMRFNCLKDALNINPNQEKVESSNTIISDGIEEQTIPSKKSNDLFDDIEDVLNDDVIGIDEGDGDHHITHTKCRNVAMNEAKTCHNPTFISIAISNYCRQIQCLNSDHMVMIFNQYKWHSSVDYLFLRLNFPNRDKLKQKLLRNSTYCGYAYQCQIVNINKHEKAE